MTALLQVYPICQVKRLQDTPPSYLYSLEPIGLNTPYVESLTGYIVRLAQEHGLSVRDLVLHGINPQYGLHLENSKNQSVASKLWSDSGALINGSRTYAYRWMNIMERMACQNLYCLTMLTWGKVISGSTKLKLLNHSRRRCAECYNGSRDEGLVIYDQLIWNLAAVEICPYHKIYLSSFCGNCSQSSYLMLQNARPGYCGKCGHWLGDDNILYMESNKYRQEWQDWVGSSVGGLIAAAPICAREPTTEGLKKCILSYIDIIGKGAQAELVRNMNIKASSLYKITNGQGLPSLITILRLSYFLKIQLLDIFCNEDIEKLVELNINNGIIYRPKLTARANIILGEDEVKYLISELEHYLSMAEYMKVSISDISKRFGYSIGLMRKYSSGLIDKIIALQDKKYDRVSYRKYLDMVVQENPPPSLRQVEKRLGFKIGPLIRRHFPDMAAIIVERYKVYKASLNEMRILSTCDAIRNATINLYNEGGDPSKLAISKRLGWVSTGKMRTPEFFRAWRDARDELGLE